MSESNHSDQMNRLLDGLEEVKGTVHKLDKKLDVQNERIQSEIDRIVEEDKRQNDSLEEHIEGVNTNRQLIEEVRSNHEKRIQKMENWKTAAFAMLSISVSLVSVAWMVLQIMGLL